MSGKVALQHQQQTMTGLRDELLKTLAAVVPRGIPVALLDVPIHTNFGDWIIWLASESFLADRDCPVVYRASRRDFNSATLRCRIGPETMIVCQRGSQ